MIVYVKSSIFVRQVQKDEHYSRSVRSAQTSMVNSQNVIHLDDLLENNNELTASKLKVKLLERCNNFPDNAWLISND